MDKNQQFVVLPKKEKEKDQLKKYEILIYVCIRRHMNSKTLEAFPSIETIAKESSCSKKTVLDTIEKIQQKGYFTIKKIGKCNHYFFSNEKHFEPFSYDFLDNPELNKSEKLQILCTQQYMIKTQITDDNGEEQGFGAISMSDRQLALCTGLDRNSIARNNKSLIEKGFASQISLKVKDPETGLMNKQMIYRLSEIGQAIVFTLQNHEDRINDNTGRIGQLEKAVALLVREIQRRDAKEIEEKKKEGEFFFENSALHNNTLSIEEIIEKFSD